MTLLGWVVRSSTGVVLVVSKSADWLVPLCVRCTVGEKEVDDDTEDWEQEDQKRP